MATAREELLRKVDVTDIDFTNEQELAYFQEALFGEKVREFLNSEVGRYLHGRAKNTYEEAKEAAIKCNQDSAYGRRKFLQYQRQADMASHFMQWLAEALANGDEAFQMMDKVRSIE